VNLIGKVCDASFQQGKLVYFSFVGQR
jgi:hypothetical protein